MVQAIANLTSGFRTLPHNIEAEQIVLGGLLLAEIDRPDHPALDVVTGLKAEDFYEPVHGRIFAEIQKRAARSELADAVAMRRYFDEDKDLADDMLQGGAYLASLVVAARGIVTLPHYVALVRHHSRKRQWIAALEVETARLYDGFADAESVSDSAGRLSGLVEEIGAAHHANTPRHIRNVLMTVIDHLDAPTVPVSTGYERIDHSTGGLFPGRVYGIQARPKGFKTGTLGSIARNVALEGHKIGYIALEMGAERIVQRMIAAHRFNSNFFRKPNADCRHMAVEGMRQAKERMDILFVDRAGITRADLAEIFRDLAREGVVGVFLDYYQLVRRENSRIGMTEHLDDLAYWLAEEAKRRQMWVMVAAQLNRDGQTRSSDGLSQACDWLATIHRVEKQNEADMTEVGLWFEVAQTRDGMSGPIGTEEDPAFYICTKGPVLKEWGRW